MSERYWKVLSDDGRSCHGGEFQWSLPRWDKRRGWIPGQWTPAIRDLEPCRRGYHVCRDRDLIHWIGARIYACEVRGQTMEHTSADGATKVVAESVRLTCPTPWDDVSARLFAVECASDVLSLYESKYPNDPRVSDCLQIAFRFALGDATEAELAAAWAAAGAAAWDAARAAARDAARAAARDAARDAAGAAAGDAARDAAGAAAGDAARDAQTQRLLWWIGAV